MPDVMTATMEEAGSNFYGDQLSASQYEELMSTFSRSSSHAVHLSRAITADLRLDKLGEERQERLQHDDDDTARIVDLGAGPGVSLGGILKHVGLVREVFTDASISNTASSILGQIDTEFGNNNGMNRQPKTTTRIVDNAATAAAASRAAPLQETVRAAALSVWCVDPFYYKEPRSDSGSESESMTPLGQTTLPTDVNGCRLEVIGEGRVHFVSADAIEFLQSCRERIGLVDRILMKEVIHHVHDYSGLCEGLLHVLRPGTGMALIAGRTPSGEIPWFPQAERLFAESCMDVERICEHVRRVPGLRVATREHSFDVHINLSDWCTLLRGRFWSNLATISDDEMERGISEVRRVYRGNDAAPLVFPDRFVFIQVFRDSD